MPPKAWPYPKDMLIAFFWDWLAKDYDPAFTPDGKPWQEQDQDFWDLLHYIQDLWRWAEAKAKQPMLPLIKPGDKA